MYASAFCTTHETESCVKKCKHVDNNGRTGSRVSQRFILYNNIKQLNEMTTAEMIAQKNEQGKEYKNNKNVKPRGTVKLVTAFKLVKARHIRIERAKSGNHRLEEVYQEIKRSSKHSPENSYSYDAERILENFELRQILGNVDRAPNQIERDNAFDITPLASNQVQFGKVFKLHELGIDAELNARGVHDLSVYKNFTAKKNKLREIVARETNQQVKETKFFPIKSEYNWPLASFFDNE